MRLPWSRRADASRAARSGWRGGWRGACLLVALLASPAWSQQADSPNLESDLRGIRVGMPASDLPRTGFSGFSCAARPAIAPAGFERWRDCPPDPDGRHAVHFEYDPASPGKGTLVAGHPVKLTLKVSADGRVGNLQIETDPDARPFLRKKAFLLGLQARSRYGDDGWKCQEETPRPGEEPVGGLYIRERCAKQVDDRMIHVERNLYRRADQDQKQFVGRTRIDIEWVPG